jgi:hypothetical protein
MFTDNNDGRARIDGSERRIMLEERNILVQIRD